MSDAVVIQWARLGDLLQTRLLLQRLQETRTEARRILCADARYADVIRLFPETIEFWPVNLQKWTALSRHSSSHGELLRSLIGDRECIREVREPETFVLTKSGAAVVFAEQLQPIRQWGYCRRGKELACPQDMEKIESAFERGTHVPAHVSDLWAAWAGDPVRAGWLPPLRIGRAVDERSGADPPHIGVFCDAGESHRCIPRVWLARLAQEFIARFTSVTFFGAAAGTERDELADLSMAFPSSVKDRRGRTSLESLSRVLTEQQLVIGADTGGLHLAAALGVPVIGLYFGGANCALTGPYSQNAAVLQDLTWDSESIQAVVSLAGEAMSAPWEQHSEFVCVMRPLLDRFGIRYISEYGAAGHVRAAEEARAEWFSRRQPDWEKAERCGKLHR